MDFSSNSREMELKMHHTRVGIELSELESYAMFYYLVLKCTQSRIRMECIDMHIRMRFTYNYIHTRACGITYFMRFNSNLYFQNPFNGRMKIRISGSGINSVLNRRALHNKDVLVISKKMEAKPCIARAFIRTL